MKLSLPLLAVLLCICLVLPCCKKTGCTDLQATNYNASAKEDPEDTECTYGSVSFYTTLVDTIYKIEPEQINGTDTIPADTINVTAVSILFDKSELGKLVPIGELSDKINGNPICYLPQMKTIDIDAVKDRRTYTWSANLILDNGDTIYDVKHGTFEPGKDCQALQVYP